MKTPRIILSLTLAACALVSPLHAEEFPTKQIHIVVPYAPGGTSDVLARAVQPELTRLLEQTVVVENRAGGASVIGTNVVAKSPPDGYTLLVGDTSLFVNPSLTPKTLPYDTERDFQGITMLARAPLYLLVKASSPFKDAKELVAYAKTHPGKLTYSSGGNGSSPHMIGEMFKLAAGVDLLHVPYGGGAPAVRALLAGEVDIYFGGTTAAPQIHAGTMRALAVTGSERDQLLSDVPTFQELGIDDMEDGYTYWGMFAPAGVESERASLLSKAIHDAMKSQEFHNTLETRGLTAAPNSPQEHTAQFKQMLKDWQSIVQRANIQVSE